jgi:hypothetical protein
MSGNEEVERWQTRLDERALSVTACDESPDAHCESKNHEHIIARAAECVP